MEAVFSVRPSGSPSGSLSGVPSGGPSGGPSRAVGWPVQGLRAARPGPSGGLSRGLEGLLDRTADGRKAS